MWSKTDFTKVEKKIRSLERGMIEMQRVITAIPALSPDAGGTGEEKKAAAVAKMVKALKPNEFKIISAPDKRVPSGGRPSVIAKWHGRDRKRTLWIMAHLDIVAPGPLDKWNSDPYKIAVKGGKIFGRGVEDNQQALVASFHAVKGMLECGLKPELNVGLIYVADEELGSKYGIDYILKKHGRMFDKKDIIFVPDTGVPDGSEIEVAEKSLFWMKITVIGKQSHGSLPGAGNNAYRAGAKLLLAIDKAVHAKFRGINKLFSPPESTFEPTKKEKNVDSINIIPGEDIFHFDCRILPGINLDRIVAVFKTEARKIEKLQKVKVKLEPIQKVQAAPPTDVKSEVVQRLMKALRETRPGIRPKPVGIGGGTVASFFRRKGYGVAVWGTIDETMHKPNEYCVVKHMVADSIVFAHMFGQ
jgi:succinyl-diaminopimelate desuccinylase